MKHLLVQFLMMTILSLYLALAEDPAAQLKLEKITINTAPNNPYIDEWSSKILSPGNRISMKRPIKKDVPEDMMIKLVAEFEGTLLVNTNLKICDTFKDEDVGKDFFENGIFNDNFPKSCPIKAGDYEVIQYTLPTDKLPPGSPDGKFVIIESIYETGNDPYVTIRYEGEVIHS